MSVRDLDNTLPNIFAAISAPHRAMKKRAFFMKNKESKVLDTNTHRARADKVAVWA